MPTLQNLTIFSNTYMFYRIFKFWGGGNPLRIPTRLLCLSLPTVQYNLSVQISQSQVSIERLAQIGL